MMSSLRPLADASNRLEEMFNDLELPEEIIDALMTQVCRIECLNVELGREAERERLLMLGQLLPVSWR